MPYERNALARAPEMELSQFLIPPPQPWSGGNALATRVNGTGSHWYPNRDDVQQQYAHPNVVPQFVPWWEFDDKIGQAPPGLAGRGLGFDPMDPSERGAGAYYPSAGGFNPIGSPMPSPRFR